MAEWVAAGTAALALAYSAYAGERGNAAQRKAAMRQRDAQQKAEASALAQQRAAQEANAAANREKPDAGRLLAEAQAQRADMVSGAGVDPSRLQLGRKSLLGS